MNLLIWHGRVWEWHENELRFSVADGDVWEYPFPVENVIKVGRRFNEDIPISCVGNAGNKLRITLVDGQTWDLTERDEDDAIPFQLQKVLDR